MSEQCCLAWYELLSMRSCSTHGTGMRSGDIALLICPRYLGRFQFPLHTELARNVKSSFGVDPRPSSYQIKVLPN